MATVATSDDASTTATAGASAAGSNAVVVVRRDPWSRLIDRLGDLDDGARGAAVKTLLEKRGRERKQEDQKLDGEMVTVQALLVGSCTPPNLDLAFKSYQALEVASLAADRDLLRQILDTAGADGLTKLWASGDIDQILTQPREVMISRAQSQLPSWLTVADSEGARLDAQRIVLSLNLATEGSAIRSRLALGRLGDALAAADPSAPGLVDSVISGLEVVDNTLVAEQLTRFDAIAGACARIPAQQWMFLIAGGGISSYVGSLGGTSGVGDPQDRRVVTTNLLGSGSMSGNQNMGMGQTSAGSGQQGGGLSGGGGGQLGGGGGGQLGGGGGGGAASSGTPSNGGSQGPPTGGNANPR